MKQDPSYPTPLKLCVMTTATIFLGEVIVMIVLAALPPLSIVPEAVVDGMMISALMVPSLYIFLYRPMTSEISRRRTTEEELEALNQDLEKTVQRKIAEKFRTEERLEKEVSEKRQAREEIWRDREFIRSVVEAAPCLFLIYDVAARRCVFVNGRVEDLLGYAVEEVVESARDFLKDVLSSEDYSNFFRELLESAGEGSATRDLGEIGMRKQSGEWKQMFARSVVLRRDPQGGTLEILLSAMEVGD